MILNVAPAPFRRLWSLAQGLRVLQLIGLSLSLTVAVCCSQFQRSCGSQFEEEHVTSRLRPQYEEVFGIVVISGLDLA